MNEVEARGVEPLSELPLMKASPCVVSHLISARELRLTKSPAPSTLLFSPPVPRARTKDQPVVVAPLVHRLRWRDVVAIRPRGQAR